MILLLSILSRTQWLMVLSALLCWLDVCTIRRVSFSGTVEGKTNKKESTTGYGWVLAAHMGNYTFSLEY